MALVDNLVAYYKLDTDWTDVLATYNATNTSSTITTGGIIGSCANLSGSGQYFRSPAPVGTNGAISVWFQFTSFVDSMVLGLSDVGVSDYLRIRPYTNTDIQFTVQDDNVNAVVPALGTTWHNAVITWSSSVAWKCYLDGNLVGTGVGVKNPTAAFTIPFGVLSDGASIWSSPFYFNGKLDEVGIWSRFLGATDVTELWNSGAGKPYPFTSAQTNSGFMAFF